MALSALLTEAIDDLSEDDLRLIGRGLALLGEHDMEEGEELDRLAAEILVFDEAVDADTIAKYKAARAGGKSASSALKHAKKKGPPPAAAKAPDKGEDKYKKMTAKHPSLSTLSKNKKLGSGEKMVFGRVVKVAA